MQALKKWNMKLTDKLKESRTILLQQTNDVEF